MSSSHRPYTGLSFADAVQAERDYQDRKWGERGSHTWYRWFKILAEEVIEVRDQAQAFQTVSLPHLRAELIQVAAVCAAILEHIDEVEQEARNA